MVVMAKTASEPGRVVVVIASVLVTALLTFAILRSALLVERRLKTTGMNILARVTGLILAAVAVQFVVDGVHDVMPQILP